MSAWKVGQRVRIIRADPAWIEVVGREGVITELAGSRVYFTVEVDGFGSRCCLPSSLEPLTPPGQKEFKAEDILTLENLPDFKTMTPEFARAWGGA